MIIPRRTNLRLLLRRPLRLGRAYWPVLVLLAASAGADAFTTFQNMRAYGADIEVHFAQRIVSQVLGVSLGVPVAKLIQLAFVLLVACWWRPWCPWILWICTALYTFAALSNHFLWL